MSQSCYSTLAGTDLNMVLGATSGTSAYTIPRSDAKKICIGLESCCNSASGVVIGSHACIDSSYTKGGVAIGKESSLTGYYDTNGVAIGNCASTSGGVAIGCDAHDKYGSGVAIGQNATTNISGNYSSAYENGPVSIGYGAGSEHAGVAIGAAAGCNEKSVALGAWSSAASGSVAIGYYARTKKYGSSNEHSIAIGSGAWAENKGIAIGYNASTSGMGERALSIGYNAGKDAENYDVFIGVGNFAIRMSAFDFINTFACMGGQSGSWNSEQGKYVF